MNLILDRVHHESFTTDNPNNDKLQNLRTIQNETIFISTKILLHFFKIQEDL